MKKIILSIMLISIIVQNVFGSTLILENMEDTTMYREYEVSEEEQDTFYNNLEDIIKVEEKQYKKIEYTVSGGNEQDIIEVTDKREIITKTNSITEILNYLPRELEYNKNSYIGKTNLNIDDIKVYEIYNGYYEEYVEEVKQYFDLPKNDMEYIPKEIIKDGITLYLINVEWYTQTTKKTGDIEITDLYRGEAYYKGVEKIDNPSTFRVIAAYNGVATKEIKKPYIFTVKYEEIVNEKQNIVVPVLIGTISSIFIVVIIIFFNNKKVKVYNLQYGQYKYLGSLKIKKSVLNLDKLRKKIVGNKYKFILNNVAYKKYKDFNITIKKDNINKNYHINNKEIEVKI